MQFITSPFSSGNEIEPEILFFNLLHESSKRTIIEKGVGDTILHLFTFPFEFLYHFAPWTILIVLLLNKGLRTILRQNDFLTYSLLVFLTNIIIYWISPEIYARYLFMLLPLVFTLLISSYFPRQLINGVQRKVVDYFFILSTATIALACVAAPIIPQLQNTEHLFIKSISIALLLSLLVYFMVCYPAERLLGFAISIAIFRLGFNWLVVENRGRRFEELKATANTIVKYSNNKDLYIFNNTAVAGNLDGLTFHIITNRKKLLNSTKNIDYNAFYITDTESVRDKKYVSLMQFKNYSNPPLMLVKFVQ